MLAGPNDVHPYRLYGREAEVALIQKHLIEGAKAIIVKGNAGMGKSRLLLELSGLTELRTPSAIRPGEELVCHARPHYEEITANDSVDGLILRLVDHAFLTSGRPLQDKIKRLKEGGLGRFFAHGALTFGGAAVGAEVGVGVLTDFVHALMAGPQASPREAFLTLVNGIQVNPNFRAVFVIDSTSGALHETYASWQDFARRLPRNVTLIFAARPDDRLLTGAFVRHPAVKIVELSGLSEEAVDKACDTAIGLPDLDRDLLKKKLRGFRGYPLHIFTCLDYLRWQAVPVAQLPNTMDDLLEDIWRTAVQVEGASSLLVAHALWNRPISEEAAEVTSGLDPESCLRILGSPTVAGLLPQKGELRGSYHEVWSDLVIRKHREPAIRAAKERARDWLWKRLGDRNRDFLDPDGALDGLRFAVELDGAEAGLSWTGHLTSELSRTGRGAELEQVAEDLVASTSSSIPALIFLGNSLLSTGKWEASADNYHKALAKGKGIAEPNEDDKLRTGEALVGLAGAQFLLKNFTDSLESCDECIALGDRALGVSNDYSVRFAWTSLLEAALYCKVQCYKELQLWDELFEPASKLAESFKLSGQIHIAHHRQSAPAILEELGEAAAQAGDLDTAVRFFEESVNICRENVRANATDLRFLTSLSIGLKKLSALLLNLDSKSLQAWELLLEGLNVDEELIRQHPAVTEEFLGLGVLELWNLTPVEHRGQLQVRLEKLLSHIAKYADVSEIRAKLV